MQTLDDSMKLRRPKPRRGVPLVWFFVTVLVAAAGAALATAYTYEKQMDEDYKARLDAIGDGAEKRTAELQAELDAMPRQNGD